MISCVISLCEMSCVIVEFGSTEEEEMEGCKRKKKTHSDVGKTTKARLLDYFHISIWLT